MRMPLYVLDELETICSLIERGPSNIDLDKLNQILYDLQRVRDMWVKELDEPRIVWEERGEL